MQSENKWKLKRMETSKRDITNQRKFPTKGDTLFFESTYVMITCIINIFSQKKTHWNKQGLAKVSNVYFTKAFLL